MNIKYQILIGEFCENFVSLKENLINKIKNLKSKSILYLSNEEVELVSEDQEIINLCLDKNIRFGTDKKDIINSYLPNLSLDNYEISNDSVSGFPVIFINNENLISIESCFSSIPEDHITTTKVFAYAC